jgi:hypothetical protein
MTKKRFLIAVTSLLAVFLLGCPPHKSIYDITRDPQHYANNDVWVSGTVTNSFGILVAGAYEIDDGTGKMWVLSNGSVPSKGSRVAARGNVEPTLSIGGRSFTTILREKERKHR